MLKLHTVEISYLDKQSIYNKDRFEFLIDDDSKAEECANYLFRQKHKNKIVQKLSTRYYSSFIYNFHRFDDILKHEPIEKIKKSISKKIIKRSTVDIKPIRTKHNRNKCIKGFSAE